MMCFRWVIQSQNYGIKGVTKLVLLLLKYTLHGHFGLSDPGSGRFTLILTVVHLCINTDMLLLSLLLLLSSQSIP